MQYKRSSDTFPFSGNRFETTYSSSYNRIINYPNKSNLVKIPDNKSLEIKTKYEPIISFSPPKTKPTPIEIKPEIVSTLSPPKEIVREFNYSHMVTQIARITDSLFLSSMHAITDERLKSLGISLVVSLVTDQSLVRLPPGIPRLQVAIDDTETANIRRHFEPVLDRIRAEIERGGRVLVHCVAGVSRSSTIVLAFLMRHSNMRLRHAYDSVLAARPYIQPNIGFWRQLIEYERQIFGSVTVAMVPAATADNSRVLVPDVPPSVLAQVVSAAQGLPHGGSLHQSRSPLAIYPLSRSPFNSY